MKQILTKKEKRATRSPGTAAKDPRFAYTLANGLRMLEAFSADSVKLGNKDFCAATGEHKSTVWRLTRTLCKLGYLTQSPSDGKFELGLKVLSLAYPRLVNLPIRRIAHPLMQDLAERINGAVNMGLQDGVDLVFVESCRTLDTLVSRPEIGARRPISSNNDLGVIYLAGLSKENRELAYEEIHNRNAGDLPALKAAVQLRAKQMAKTGFCFASQRGINAIASTFKVSRQGHMGLLVCVVQERTMSRQRMLGEVPDALLRVVGRIEDLVGTR